MRSFDSRVKGPKRCDGLAVGRLPRTFLRRQSRSQRLSGQHASLARRKRLLRARSWPICRQLDATTRVGGPIRPIRKAQMPRRLGGDSLPLWPSAGQSTEVAAEVLGSTPAETFTSSISWGGAHCGHRPGRHQPRRLAPWVMGVQMTKAMGYPADSVSTAALGACNGVSTIRGGMRAPPAEGATPSGWCVPACATSAEAAILVG